MKVERKLRWMFFIVENTYYSSIVIKIDKILNRNNITRTDVIHIKEDQIGAYPN